MAIIKCPKCHRYMGAGVRQCIYCDETFTGKNITIINADNAKDTSCDSTADRPSPYQVLITTIGFLLTAAGVLLFDAIPLFAIPLVLFGGWIFWKHAANSK